ncbi:hypothetical protein ANCCAN_17785 [Ancylostoma caninum]|uniref:Trypsin Inhibitor like cysteine rich domain protein n=1 Tax=Ancylostoma caninum TaxID=29170 RepID=A0A368G011_ANCCA|nr:hypothetical protein ANCCAN_17785 [Ancylostoma caninum]
MDSPDGSGEGSSNPDEIVPCAAMQCPEGFTCEEGEVICPFVPPCFTRPTACVPNGDCAVNMYSATCGPLCSQDCTNDLRCLAITCTDEERCFCNPGYVLLNKDDPSFGCVLPEECPNAPVDSL